MPRGEVETNIRNEAKDVQPRRRVNAPRPIQNQHQIERRATLEVRVSRKRCDTPIRYRVGCHRAACLACCAGAGRTERGGDALGAGRGVGTVGIFGTGLPAEPAPAAPEMPLTRICTDTCVAAHVELTLVTVRAGRTCAAALVAGGASVEDDVALGAARESAVQVGKAVPRAPERKYQW